VDLIIADMPKGLPILDLSISSTIISKWNEYFDTWLESIFEFVDGHLQDDRALIIVHPYKAQAKSDIYTYVDPYGFRLQKEWWGMNHLYLTSPSNLSSTIRPTFITSFQIFRYFNIISNYLY